MAPETPLKETQAYADRYGFPLARNLPRVLDDLQIDLQNVLDLTNNEIRQRLGVSEEQMREERWWEQQAVGQEALTQAIGRAAYEAGFEGVLVPCAPAPGEVNLIVFPENLRPGSRMTA